MRMSSTDCAISSKPIPDCDWNLVFTRLGKYFFYNPKNGERSWIPPMNVLTVLKEKFTPTRREMFFDPFYEEAEEEELEETDESSINIRDTADSTICDKDDLGSRVVTPSSDAEDQLKLYLLKNNVDPFSPWPKILSIHSTSPEFLAIPSDKRRQDLFTQICPVLIENRRQLTRKNLQDAKNWWEAVKLENWKAECSWFQVIKKVKGNSKFALLNEKECEKDYKNRNKKI